MLIYSGHNPIEAQAVYDFLTNQGWHCRLSNVGGTFGLSHFSIYVMDENASEENFREKIESFLNQDVIMQTEDLPEELRPEPEPSVPLHNQEKKNIGPHFLIAVVLLVIIYVGATIVTGQLFWSLPVTIYRLINEIIFLFLIYVYLKISYRKSWREILGLQPVSLKLVLKWVIIWVAYYIVLHREIFPFLHVPTETPLEISSETFLFAIILAPIVEELIYRGFVLSSFKRSMNPYLAVVITGLLFGFSHYQYHWQTQALIAVDGIFFGIAYLRTRSVYTSMVLHMLLNSSVFILRIIHG